VYVDDYELTDKEHRQITNAIKKGNLPMAEKSLVAHFARGEQYVLDLD
jgi:DNA-binding GntR family transcriptional regulator